MSADHQEDDDGIDVRIEGVGTTRTVEGAMARLQEHLRLHVIDHVLFYDRRGPVTFSGDADEQLVRAHFLAVAVCLLEVLHGPPPKWPPAGTRFPALEACSRFCADTRHGLNDQYEAWQTSNAGANHGELLVRMSAEHDATQAHLNPPADALEG